MATASSCVFCDILAGRTPGSVVYRDGLVTAFMDIQPINPGHLLVVPNEHAADLAELPAATGARLFEVGQRLAAALRRTAVRCEGINLFVADGEPAGQEVFHVHLHVLPRFKADGFGLHYGAHYFERPSREALDEVAEAIRRQFEP